jgi:hypothetical protein
MNKVGLIILLLVLGFKAQGQTFQMPDGVDEIEIPVEIVSNLMVVKASVNGTSMRFILDSGATRTTIFNINGVDSLNIGTGNNTVVKGYGSIKPYEALYSQGNLINIEEFTAINAEMYVLTQEQISFVPLLGQEVNGIIGIDFFKDHLVELDYQRNQITVVAAGNQKLKRKYDRSTTMDTSTGKPYIDARAWHKESSQDLSLLLDTGSGDALWFFEKSTEFKMPKKGFRDYLGFGLSGDVYGFRSKIDSLTLNGITFKKITVAFPEMERKEQPTTKNTFLGSMGGEVLRRFNILMDYPNKKVYFEANRAFNNGFYYNMAGLKLREGEKELVTGIQYDYEKDNRRESRSLKKVKYTGNKSMFYTYTPKILVSYIVPGSPADEAGIEEGDQVVGFNGKEIGKFRMGEISTLFYNNPYSVIKLRMKKGEEYYSAQLQLIPIIEDD